MVLQSRDSIESMKRTKMIITLAERIGKISNPELRDLAAYTLDEVHGWRCGVLADMDECAAVEEAFTEEETLARRVLQPTTWWRGTYIHGPFLRWIQSLQEWDDDNENTYWKWSNDFVKLWKFAPKPHNEFPLIARFAARRTWYSADQFIAEYVAASVPRLIDDLHGIPSFFDTTGKLHTLSLAEAEAEEDIGILCYKYSLRVLGEMAREYLDDDNDDFPDALAEAIKLGMLWD